jgi:hypothetical protein
MEIFRKFNRNLMNVNIRHQTRRPRAPFRQGLLELCGCVRRAHIRALSTCLYGKVNIDLDQLKAQHTRNDSLDDDNKVMMVLSESMAAGQALVRGSKLRKRADICEFVG